MQHMFAPPFTHPNPATHAGGDLAKIQAHIRGRYQRRIMAKAKREAKELEKMEALGQLPSHRGSVMDEHDEYGNKKVTFC